jgi:hypothetical protein
MDEQEKYIQGFNEAVILATYDPKVFAAIEKYLSPSTPYLEGMRDGGQQRKNEQEQQIPNEFTRLRNKSKDRNMGHDR